MIEVFKHASALPDEWDKAAGSNAALHRDNLALLERVNPCRQEYVVFREDEVYAILVKYVLKLDIFCYSRIHFYLPVTVVGIPCSVDEPGYCISGSASAEVKGYLSGLKGAKLILNAAENLEFLGFTKGYTLPGCVLDIRWHSFEDYLLGLRSHYRYRYRKALKKAEALSIEALEGEFDQRLYRLYEQVYDRSEYKLEKLPIDFFREAKAAVTMFEKDKEPVAFVQYVIEGRKMTFLFGGLDYRLNKEFDLYQNMLLYLVRTAIENNCTSLDLGQTAEEMKCRLGARLEKKYLYIHHDNGVINWLVKKFSRLFSYKMPQAVFKVCKEVRN